jgi:putative transposase
VLSKLACLTLRRSIQLLRPAQPWRRRKDLEILVLRHQLAVLRRQISRPRLQPADQALLATVSRVLPRSRWSCFLTKPDTLLRRHRRLVLGAWTYPHRQIGRPPLDQEVQQLITRLARESPGGGYQRIKGELQRLGTHISATAIRSTLRRYGLDPAPRRAHRSWPAFLRQQAAGIVACDFLTIDTVWLRRLCVLFFIELDTRRIHLAWAITNPNGGWVTQQAREVLPQLRRCVRLRGRQGARRAGAGAQSERVRGALGPRDPCRAPGLASHGRAPPPRAAPWSLGEHYNQHRPHRALDCRRQIRRPG